MSLVRAIMARIHRAEARHLGLRRRNVRRAKRKRRLRCTRKLRRSIARTMWELDPQSLRYLHEAARGLIEEQRRR